MMNVIFRNDFFKQATMLMLCGLLPYFCVAQTRSKSDVVSIAHDFASKNPKLHGTTELKLNVASSQISSNEGLCSDKEAYYIFSDVSKSGGFVIVSGDERMPAVLAYSDENSFDVDNIPPNVQYWLDCYAESYMQLDTNDGSSNVSLTYVNEDGVAPLLGNNSWNQSNPYNLLCPSVKGEKCVTGCVATAMAQVMNYYKYPAVGKGYISYRTETNGIQLQNNLSTVYFKWEDMLDDYSMNHSSAQANAVAELMYACGTSVHMDYCTSSQGGSGAYQSDLIPAFIDNFDYDHDAAFMLRSYCSAEDWHRILINELNEGHPINYGGQSIRDGGHSFVVDGYKVSNDKKYPDYHVNWGWGGSCNGYYQIAALNPSENGLAATMSGFNSNQQITIGVKPDDGVDNDIFFFCTSNLHTSSVSAKPGATIQVYSASMNNLSYKDFSGTLHVALISQNDGSEIILGESNVRTLAYLQKKDNISIEITLPSDIAEEKYIVQLRAKQTGSKKYNQIYSSSYPELTVSVNGKNDPIIVKETLLGSSELELVKTSNPTEISLNLYELQNLQEAPFIGDLRMVLADDMGNQLAVFGDSVHVGELSMYEIQDRPQKMRGNLSGDWGNGDYRIYVGARAINTTDYVYVSYYDIARPNMANQELFLDAQIKDNILSINGHSYKIITTSVNSATMNESQEINIYDLNGSQLKGYNPKTLRKGIYIIRQGSDSRKLVIH